MKVIVIGANGTIGKEVVEALSTRHHVVSVARNEGDFKADISSAESLERLFEEAAPFDAVVCCAGAARFKPLSDLTEEDFEFSLSNKLMGQVNVVRLGSKKISPGGSFTITSGDLAEQPAPGSGAVSLVNAGLEGFAKAAALELGARQVRVNAVSPPWVAETLIALGMDPSQGLTAEQVANAYVESVENGARTGEVLHATDFVRTTQAR